MKDICVVYLAWQPLGIEPFERFIESYKRHPAGVDHDLIVLAKGYNRNEICEIDGEKQKVIYLLPDEGFDITNYAMVVESYQSQYKYFCFLNSYSQIQASWWLQKLYQVITQPNVGLVGCTGSWETAEGYPPFPNYHIRTNAFMIEGKTFLDFCDPVPMTKPECNEFEAGNNSLTRKIQSTGKKCLIVGKDDFYLPGVAPLSFTFRMGDQENLLVSDNRTDHYYYGDEATRAYLKRLAWRE